MYNLINKILSLLLLASLAINAWLYSEFRQLQRLPEETQSQNNLPNSATLLPTANENDAPANNVFSTETQQTNELQRLAEQAFTAREFELAVEYYSELLRQNEVLANELLQQWVFASKQWIATGHIQNTESFVTAFLQYNPFEISVLEVEAKRLEFVNQLPKAIDTYRLMIENSLDLEDISNWLSTVHALVFQQHQLYEVAEQWLTIVEFIEPMLYLEPNYLPYQYMFASALFHLGRYQESKSLLNSLQFEPEFKVRAENLLQKIANQLAANQQVELTQIGAHYIVEGIIEQQSAIELMIDTGASLSVMSLQKFEQLSSWHSPTYIRSADMNTAGGVVNAPIYRFENFTIAGLTINEFDFVVMELENLDKADGLLGMNYLRYFDFQIDQSRSVLLIEFRQ